MLGVFKLLGFGSPIGGMVSVGLALALALAIAFGVHEHGALATANENLAVVNYRLLVANANIDTYQEAAAQVVALNTNDYGTLAARCAGDTSVWFQRGEAVGRAEVCNATSSTPTNPAGGTASSPAVGSPRASPGVRDYRSSRGPGYVPSHVLPR